MLRPSSLTSWRQNALDLAVDACRTVAPLVARSEAARLSLEENGYEEALRWLEERPLSPLAELLAHLERGAVSSGLANAEISPPWGAPPDELLEHLTQLEEKARLALRMYARATPPPLLVKDPTAPLPSATSTLHRRAREHLTRLRAALAEPAGGDPAADTAGEPVPLAEENPPPKGAKEAAAKPTPAALRLSLHGPSPHRYQKLSGGAWIAVFHPGVRLVVKASAPPSRSSSSPTVTLLVTSEQGALELVLPGGEADRFAALDELEAGAYCLDLLGDEGNQARLCFLVEAGEPSLPAGAARVILGGSELVWEGHLALDVTLREQEPLELRLPPLWPVRLFWREIALRSLGRRFADRSGLLGDLLPSMQHRLATATVADLEIDAGELGVLTLRHERPSDLDQVLEGLLGLARERAAHLPRGSLELLRTLWVEPICRELGYLVGQPRPLRQQGPLLQELSTLARVEGHLTRLSHTALWLSSEPPVPEECWREMGEKTTRILWTDGWRWERAELGRRRMERIAEIPAGCPPEALSLVRSSFRSLAERLGWW